ncbi:MAG: C4-dicarboxylate transporter substrate-binding protein [Tardiphaga sp.]|nr:C4-dicarboxylate transporter substrate-binding protein [Tardiphaga sp.]MDB5573752.1 C4-dicarboxylate transporter substrate-binding protein [Tardiphaga sp.]MDB5628551.1 C4-dicarboxylate transporter substrate-binding protein [Tardiphaga sp.]
MKAITIGVAMLGLMLGSGAALSQTKTLAIATGGTGGIFYPLGGGLANMLSKKLPDTQATAEVTGGSVDNIKLLESGQADMGFMTGDVAADAVKGEGKFKKAVPLRTIVAIYSSPVHVVTINGTGIEKFADLKGRRISSGAPGSATETQTFRLLEAAGIDKDKDVKRERLSVSESGAALKDRKIDAFFWGGGVPTAAITDLAATPGVTIRLIDIDDLLDPIVKKYGRIFAPSVIKAGSYPGQTKDSPGFSAWNQVMATDTMSDDMAYAITKAVFENKADLVAVHMEAKNIDLATQTDKESPAPYHPGALKYLKENGARP